MAAPHCALSISALNSWLPGSDAPVDLHLVADTKGIKASGRVVDFKKVPIANAQVKLDDVTEWTMRPWHLNKLGWDMPELVTTSGPDGRFSFPAIKVESSEEVNLVHASATGIAGGKSFYAAGSGHTPEASIDIVFVPNFSVSGKVIDLFTKTGIPNAEVSISTTGRDDSLRLSTTLTDKNGLFIMKDVESAQLLMAMAADANYRRGGVIVSDNGESVKNPHAVENVTIALRPFVTISVNVIDAVTGKTIIEKIQTNDTPSSLTVSCEFPIPVEGWDFSPQVCATRGKSISDALSVKSLAGHNKLKVFSNGYEFLSDEFDVEPGQHPKRTIKLQRKKGTLLHIDYPSPTDRKYQLESRNSEDQEWVKHQICCADIFLPSAEWGSKKQVRIVRSQDNKVVVPEKEIVADQNNWIVTLQIP